MNKQMQNSTSVFQRLLRMDFVALLLQVYLMCIGILFIYSTGVQNGGDLANLWHKQIVWGGIGLCIYFTVALIDYRELAKYSWVFYSLGILLLLAVLPFGKTINGARSWLALPGFGMIQPSELAKPTVLLFMAWVGTNRYLRLSNMPLWIPICAVALLPTLLIALQPDFGTALVFIPVAASVIFITGLKKIWITIIICSALILTPVIFINLRPHQQERVKVFIEAPARQLIAAIPDNMNADTKENLQQRLDDFLKTEDGKPRDDWNAKQALIAVGHGGLLGRGFRKGLLHSLGYLPKNVAPSDFIFSVIAEETGFLGAGTVLAVLIGLFLCFCRTALLARNTMGCCLAMATATLLAIHTLINIGMNVQAVPIIGIPLPFVSYGGSFAIGMFTMAGLVQSIHIHRGLPKAETEA